MLCKNRQVCGVCTGPEVCSPPPPGCQHLHPLVPPLLPVPTSLLAPLALFLVAEPLTELWARHRKCNTATKFPKPGIWRLRCIVRYPLMRNIIYFCFANKIICSIFFQSAHMYVNRPSYLQSRSRDRHREQTSGSQVQRG